eukprot:6081728-Prymnesium_polylepis.1
MHPAIRLAPRSSRWRAPAALQSESARVPACRSAHTPPSPLVSASRARLLACITCASTSMHPGSGALHMHCDHSARTNQ